MPISPRSSLKYMLGDEDSVRSLEREGRISSDSSRSCKRSGQERPTSPSVDPPSSASSSFMKLGLTRKIESGALLASQGMKAVVSQAISSSPLQGGSSRRVPLWNSSGSLKAAGGQRRGSRWVAEPRSQPAVISGRADKIIAKGLGDTITCVSFSMDGMSFAVATANGVLRVISAQTGDVLAQKPMGSGINAVVYTRLFTDRTSSDRGLIIVGTFGGMLYFLEPSKLPVSHGLVLVEVHSPLKWGGLDINAICLSEYPFDPLHQTRRLAVAGRSSFALMLEVTTVRTSAIGSGVGGANSEQAPGASSLDYEPIDDRHLKVKSLTKLGTAGVINAVAIDEVGDLLAIGGEVCHSFPGRARIHYQYTCFSSPVHLHLRLVNRWLRSRGYPTFHSLLNARPRITKPSSCITL